MDDRELAYRLDLIEASIKEVYNLLKPKQDGDTDVQSNKI